MKPRLSLFVLLASVGLISPSNAQGSDRDPVEAATALALGMAASSSAPSDPAPVATQIATLGKSLPADPARRQAVQHRAYSYTFGEAPPTHTSSQLPAGTFSAQVAAHLATLAEDAGAYRAVMQRAYQHVIGRDVYDEEVEYWGRYDTLPYTLLVGCIEDWARRNQPGLMVTAGTPSISVNCELLETRRLSPATASQAAQAIGLTADAEVIAPGGQGVRSVGGIRFLVTGVR